MRLDAARAILTAGAELSQEELLDALWLARVLPSGAADAPLARATAGRRRAPDVEPVPSAAGSPGEPVGPPRTRPAVPGPTGPPAGWGDGGPALDGPQRPPGRSAATTTGPAEAPRPQPPHADAPYRDAPPEPEAAGPDPRPSDLYGGPADAAGPAEGGGALPLRVPEAKALPAELPVGRALRPLKQRRQNPLRREFDEAATATALAESGLPDVVTRPARERWLDLALVVDGGVSMLLWRRLAVELRTLLQRSGAFRVVRVLGLDSRGAHGPTLRTRPYDDGAPRRPTAALSDPSGRTLVLVVSDGVGAAWRDGRMAGVLERWARLGPTAVVHALPPRLWDGSGIRAGRWQVTTRRPGSANADWTVADPVLPPDLARYDGVPVPVLEPAPGPLGAWARLVASPGDSVVLPLLARPRARRPGAGSTVAARPEPQSTRDERNGHATRRVQRFRDAASPEAYRLAAHLAAVAPVSVPVMRMVQAAVEWPTDTGHLAEVFLGGLMSPVAPPPAAGPDPLPPQHRLFTFPDPARDLLLSAVPSAELVRTGRVIGRRIEHLAGHAPDFPAWLAHPSGPDRVPGRTRAFTSVEHRVATRLGAPRWPDVRHRRRAAGAFRQPRPAAPVGVPHPGRSQSAGPRAVAVEGGSWVGARRWQPLTTTDPRRIGPYTVQRRDAGGSRVLAYLAQDERGGQAVVHVARPSSGRWADAVLGTMTEALGRMAGRYAPRLLGEGVTDRVRWAATEFVPGERLAHLLGGDPAGQWDGRTALTLARHLAEAVHVCHEVGLVHGGLHTGTVYVAGTVTTLTGWSSAWIDGRPPPMRTQQVDPLHPLGELLLSLGGGGTWRAPGVRHGDMPRWPGRHWQPVRDLVLACLGHAPAGRRPTIASVAEFLAAFTPDALGPDPGRAADVAPQGLLPEPQEPPADRPFPADTTEPADEPRPRDTDRFAYQADSLSPHESSGRALDPARRVAEPPAPDRLVDGTALPGGRRLAGPEHPGGLGVRGQGAGPPRTGPALPGDAPPPSDGGTPATPAPEPPRLPRDLESVRWQPLIASDPERLGPYVLERRNSSGSRVLAYLGRDARGQPAVVCTARAPRDPEAGALLRNQAEALRRMAGRHAPRLLDEGVTDGVRWIATEITGGERLADLLLRGAAASEWDGRTSLAYARRLSEAVRVCQQEGVVHGDLHAGTVQVVGDELVLMGWSSAWIDGTPPPVRTVRSSEHQPDPLRPLGELLLSLGGGGHSRESGTRYDEMPRWSGPRWRPVRELVLACLDGTASHRLTVGSVADFLAGFDADAPVQGAPYSAGTGDVVGPAEPHPGSPPSTDDGPRRAGEPPAPDAAGPADRPSPATEATEEPFAAPPPGGVTGRQNRAPDLLTTGRRPAAGSARSAGWPADRSGERGRVHGLTHCPRCGRPVDATHRFCASCGHQLFDGPAAAEQAPGADHGMPRYGEWAALRGDDPTSLGRYALSGRLGGQPSGGLYLGFDQTDPGQPPAAVRTVTGRDPDPQLAEGLRVEAEALRRMAGRYAPRLLAHGLDEDPPWLASEVVFGPDGQPARTLGSVLSARAPAWDARRAALIGWHLAEAVSLCALKGMCHTALGPDVVLVVDRTVKLICWHTAVIDGGYWPKIHRPGPEDDVFALGGLLLAVGYGRRGLPEPGRLLWDGPEWRPVREVVEACRRRDRAARPTARQVADVLADHVGPAPAPDGGAADR